LDTNYLFGVSRGLADMMRADEGEENGYDDMPPLVEDIEYKVFKSKL
jgi:hypothetical protein